MSTSVGVLGAGPSNRRNTYALLKEYLASKPDATFVLPGSAPEFQDAERHVADFAVDNNLPLVILTDGHDMADLDDYTAADPVISEVEDARDALFNVVEELIVAYDSNDERLDGEIESALHKGIKVYDLTDGLYPITLEGDQPVIPEPVAEEDEGEIIPEILALAQRHAQPDEAQATLPEPPPSQVDVEALASLVAERVWEKIIQRLSA